MTGYIINSGKVKVHTNDRRLEHGAALAQHLKLSWHKKRDKEKHDEGPMDSNSLVFELLRLATFHALSLSFCKLWYLITLLKKAMTL